MPFIEGEDKNVLCSSCFLETENENKGATTVIHKPTTPYRIKVTE